MPGLDQQPDKKADSEAPEETQAPAADTGAAKSSQQPLHGMVELVEGLKGSFIEVAADAQGAWHWALWSGNGRIIARSGQTHETFKSAVQSLRTAVKIWRSNLPIVRSHSD